MARKLLTEDEKNRGIELAERIQEMRRHRNFTQEQLSSASGINIDTLRAIEGKKVPHPGVFTLSDIASALDIDLSELIPKKKNKKTNQKHISHRGVKV